MTDVCTVIAGPEAAAYANIDAGGAGALETQPDPISIGVPDAVAGLGVPHIDQYFGTWAIHEDRFRSMVAGVERMDLRLHVSEAQHQPEAAAQNDRRYQDLYDRVDGTAVIPITGPMMKFVGSLAAGTGTVYTRKLIRAAVQDDRVKSILLVIDSPGGTVAGTADLAGDIYTAAQQKPTAAFLEDIAASAAYWAASQARRVWATPTTLVGSIGTFAVVYDMSMYAAATGIKVHILRAGAFKGAGTPGTEITPEQLTEWQRSVDGLNEFFIQFVGRGRRLPRGTVSDLADGRVHLAAEAQALGLIDGVMTIDSALEAVQSIGRRRKGQGRAAGATAEHTQESDTMNDGNTGGATAAAPHTPQPATVSELKRDFSDAGAEWRENVLEQGLTLEQATAAYGKLMRDRLEAARADNEKLKAQLAAPASGPVQDDTPAGNNKGGAASDPIATFEAAVREQMATGKSKPQATRAVVRDNPQLHVEYVEAVNIADGRHRAAEDFVSARSG